MNPNIDELLTELRMCIADLGKGGGKISPSVYDTAQILRLYPPKEGVAPALTWLQAQQQADGGWGSPQTPYTRDVPTLAAVLALHTYRHQPHAQAARDAGLDFLHRQVEKWSEIPIDALPSGAEVILPYLLSEAQSLSLKLDYGRYSNLYQLRQQKLQQIGKRPIRRGSAPSHSWEALCQDVSSIAPDPFGTIGISPAATAAWLHLAADRPDLAQSVAKAEDYLTRATEATELAIPGVVPTAWPIVGFEIAYALYALLVSGLLTHPALQDVIEPVVDELWLLMQRNHGIGFDENFTVDVDDTAVAVAVLHAKARATDPAVIFQFKNGDHFCTFHHELNPSILANAHAMYGLADSGKRFPAVEEFLLKRQTADGRWLSDKWHISWIYNTLEVVLALNQFDYSAQVAKALAIVLQAQKPEGGWGSGDSATRAETSYALLMLSFLNQCGSLDDSGKEALKRGFDFLLHANRNMQETEEYFWIAKELFAPYRIDRIYELSALISSALISIAPISIPWERDPQ